MTATEAHPAAKLAELLESAPAPVRQEIVAWLLSCRPPTQPPATRPPAWSPLPIAAHTHARLAAEATAHDRLAGTLPTGTDSQVVTLRLPADRHAALRDWCAAHGFSMAAVVRGLVERFLEEQTRSG